MYKRQVLIQALKLLHPFMPFISEEIFCNLQEEEETIMVSQWPVYRDDWSFAKEEQSTETIKEAVRAIRGVRSSMNVPPSKKATVYVVSEDAGLLQIFEHSKSFFAALGYAGEVILQENKIFDGVGRSLFEAAAVETVRKTDRGTVGCGYFLCSRIQD